MGKAITEKNRKRFLRLSIEISMKRRLKKMTQTMLAEEAGISRSLLSVIEAPSLVYNFTLDVLFNIADALGADVVDLLVDKRKLN